MRVGAILNPTSLDPALNHLADLLHGPAREMGVDLVSLFGPEHGVRGDVQYLEEIETAVDERTGLPAHSLYGKYFASLTHTEEQLRGLDALVFDIQDVGSRYYTYLATMGLCMQAAAKHDLKFVVLDRPNPIGGVAVEGGIVHPGFESFVGLWPMAARHGLTAGEMAAMLQRPTDRGGFNIGCELAVVPMLGWKRDMQFADTGLPWVMPSPNLPTPESATVYPGQVLLEGSNLSEGRGTTRPFELFGAPWIDGHMLAKKLNDLHLPGVKYREVWFMPSFSKFSGKLCGGCQLHVTDRNAYQSITTVLAELAVIKELYGSKLELHAEYFDKVMGTASVREALERGEPVTQMVADFAPGLKEFAALRQPYLLYH